MKREETKVVKVGDRNLVFRMPSVEEVTEADIEYSKAYVRALQAGILPRLALEKILERSGAWTKEDEAAIDSVSRETQELVKKLMVEKDQGARTTLIMEYYTLRQKLAELSSTKQSMLMNSAETKGEEAKITSLLWKSVKNEDGSSIWASKREFLDDRDNDLVQSVVEKFVSFMGQFDEKLGQLDKIILGDLEEEEKEVDGEVATSEKPDQEKPETEKPVTEQPEKV